MTEAVDDGNGIRGKKEKCRELSFLCVNGREEEKDRDCLSFSSLPLSFTSFPRTFFALEWERSEKERKREEKKEMKCKKVPE